MATRLALCAAVGAAAVVIGASTIASAANRGGGRSAAVHASVSHANFSRPNFSRPNFSRPNFSRTNVSHTTTATRFNGRARAAHLAKPPKAVIAAEIHNAVVRHGPGTVSSAIRPLHRPVVPKAVIAAEIHNASLQHGVPKAVIAAEIHNAGLQHGPGVPKAIIAAEIHNAGLKHGPGVPKAVIAAEIHNAGLNRGPGTVSSAIRPLHNPVLQLSNNRFAPIWREQHRIWSGGRWRVFAPYTALSAVRIGSAYYYPDSYVGLAQPYCTGVTPEGCQLHWQQVNFQDGGSDWQCVRYCAPPSAPPPPQAVSLAPRQPAEPQPPQGSCEVTIYADPNFAGTAETTGDEEPALSQSGWQNQIASIQVKSGTWDFFTDENFAGETMRLRPGPYQDLGPEWSKKIGSFHCVQPGS